MSVQAKHSAQPPIDNSRILLLPVSAENLKNQTPKREWVPPIFFSNLKSNCFGELKPHAKFQKPRTALSGRKITRSEERKKEKGAVNSATKFTLQRPKPAHATSSDQNSLCKLMIDTFLGAFTTTQTLNWPLKNSPVRCYQSWV